LVIQMPTGDVGMEITEAVPQTYAQANAIRNQLYPDAFIDRSIFTWGARFTPRQIHDYLKQNPQTLSEDSPGWTGDAVETELARAIETAIEKKLNKLNGPEFRRFPQNWLAIYASVPGPFLDHRKIAKFVTLHDPINYRHAFDRIFVLCGTKVIAFKGDTFDILPKGNAMTEFKVPQHFRFINPIIEVLKELGGSGRSGEVTDAVIEKLNIPDAEVEETISSGQSRVKNQIHWARMALVKLGIIDASQWGVWRLTEKGTQAHFTDEELYRLYKTRKEWLKLKKRSKTQKEPIESSPRSDEEEQLPESIDYRTELLQILQSLPPSGFERICQRLLRESGFEQVIVTGKSSDGGIDGHGILQVNPFVSFKVLFQCKRYQGAVTASQIRDFRGAMMGRADKGIIMTTGTFTTEAKKEARRDGVPPIEIVDGEILVEMFERLELGLKPKVTYDIDPQFFGEYQ